MNYERLSQPILPFERYLARVAKSIGLAIGVVSISLGIGVIGYHIFGGLSWLDAFLEASMILGGMGAVAPMKTAAVKIFAACYALFSGFVALSSMAIILAPWLHRLIHHMHAEPDGTHKITSKKPIKRQKPKASKRVSSLPVEDK